MPNRPVYLDYQATTPVDPSVLAAMLPYFTEAFGNAHSGEHSYALEAAEAVEVARRQVAGLIGAQAREVVFTSGATEANNLLIRGGAQAARASGRTRVVTLATEHKSVLEVVQSLAREGFCAEILPVRADGLVDLDLLASVVDRDTAVVSVMVANNEIGVLQPIETISDLCRTAGAILHCDGVQAAGKIPLECIVQSVDMMSLSAHKVYGPKGVGAAYVSRKSPFKPLPVMWGGDQERGLRPGTLPTPLCVGMGAAFALATEMVASEAERLHRLRARFLELMQVASLDFAINGDLDRRLAGNLNVSFSGIDAEALLMTLRSRVAASSGSACTANSLDPSHVVTALGFGEARAETAVRFSFGRPTTEAEVDEAAAAVVEAVRTLKRVAYAPQAAVRS
jgi:cysteine desulfurase